MNKVRVQVFNELTEEVKFDITLQNKVTILDDKSGTGKTAFCTLLNTAPYSYTITGANHLSVITSEDVVNALKQSQEDSTLMIIDEDYVLSYFDEILPLVNKQNWYILIITRDISIESQLDGVTCSFAIDDTQGNISLHSENSSHYFNKQ